MATLNVDFFRPVDVGSGGIVDLTPLFRSLAGADNDDPTRYVQYGQTHFIRLYRIDKWRTMWVGDLIRIRMDEIPVRAPLRGDIAPFELADEEGVGEPTAFIYDSRLGVLALQRNKYGVNPNGVCWFIDQIAGSSIRLAPVLQTDGVQRLMNMRRIGALEVHFAGVQNPGRFQQGGPASVKTMGSLLQQFGAANASFRVSAGRNGWSLNVDAAKSAAAELLGLASQTDVTKVEVAGRDDEDSREVIDLLKLRLSEKVTVASNARTLDYTDRIQALQAAWTKAVGELKELFEE